MRASYGVTALFWNGNNGSGSGAPASSTVGRTPCVPALKNTFVVANLHTCSHHIAHAPDTPNSSNVFTIKDPVKGRNLLQYSKIAPPSESLMSKNIDSSAVTAALEDMSISSPYSSLFALPGGCISKRLSGLRLTNVQSWERRSTTTYILTATISRTSYRQLNLEAFNP